MPLTLRPSAGSIATIRAIQDHTQGVQDEIQRLSNGRRILQAGGAPAQNALITVLDTEIRSLRRADHNANDGISLLQVAEAALSEINDSLIRMRQLALQAASDGVTDSERAYIQDEFNALRLEIDRVGVTTKFNTQTLLDGTFSSAALDFQVGLDTHTDARISVTLPRVNATVLGTSATSLQASAITGKEDARTAMDVVDAAIDDIITMQNELGAAQASLIRALDATRAKKDGLFDARRRMADTDVADSSAKLARLQILQQAAASMLTQANSQPEVALMLLQG